MFWIKPDSVPPVLLHFTPEVDFLVNMVDQALHKLGAHAYITSGMEGTHKRASKHYAGQAVDFRINWAPSYRVEFFQELTKLFGSSARYFLETDHLHTEIA